MSAHEFLADYFLPSYYYYILSIIICFLYSYLVFRNKIRSIIDPLFIAVIGWSFANSVAIFLMLCNLVSRELIFYFILSNLIISGTFYFAYPNKTTQMTRGSKYRDIRFNQYLFVLFFSIYLFTTLYKFAINGIPIFNESRFSINVDNASGILGLLSRISGVCNTYNVIYAFFLVFNGKKKKGALLLIILVIMGLLSGSKGFILSFCYAFFFYTLLYEGKVPQIKKKYFILILLTPVVVISTGGMAASGIESFVFFAYRVLAYGDIYWNAYPNEIINDINFSLPIANMTYMFWGPFRHIFGIDIPIELMNTGGSLIFEKANSFYPDGGAPNSPITVMSWIYFRWGGLLFVFILSALLSYILKKYGHIKRTLINVAIQSSLITATFSFLGDIYLVFNALFNTALLYVLYRIMLMIYILNRYNYGSAQSISYNNSL